MENTPTFTPQDAQSLVALASNAPLRNLAEAGQVSALLQRFLMWHQFVTQPAAPEETQ